MVRYHIRWRTVGILNGIALSSSGSSGNSGSGALPGGLPMGKEQKI